MLPIRYIASKLRAGLMGPDHVRVLENAQALVTVTGTVTAKATQRLVANTSGGTVTVNLPANPSEGDTVELWRNGANNLVIGRNGSTVEALTEDHTIDVDKAGVRAVYACGTWALSKTRATV